MNWLCWNFRGLGSHRTVRNLLELVKARKPLVVFLCETLVHATKRSMDQSLTVRSQLTDWAEGVGYQFCGDTLGYLSQVILLIILIYYFKKPEDLIGGLRDIMDILKDKEGQMLGSLYDGFIHMQLSRGVLQETSTINYVRMIRKV